MPPLFDPRVQGWIPWEPTRLDQRMHAPHKARTWPKGSRVPADRSAATWDGRCRHESTGESPGDPSGRTPNGQERDGSTSDASASRFRRHPVRDLSCPVFLVEGDVAEVSPSARITTPSNDEDHASAH